MESSINLNTLNPFKCKMAMEIMQWAIGYLSKARAAKGLNELRSKMHSKIIRNVLEQKPMVAPFRCSFVH